MKINTAPIELNKSIEILKKSFQHFYRKLRNLKKGRFSKEESDFKDNKLNIGAYDYENLMKCPLKFYFQNLAQLIPEKILEIEYLNKQLFETIVHKNFRKYSEGYLERDSI